MISEKDILAMLQNGESADEIAQMLADTLNKGKALYNEELAARAEAAAEAELKREKNEEMTEILTLIHNFIYKYYCETEEDVAQLDDIFNSLDVDDLIKQIEEVGTMAFEFSKAFDELFPKNEENKAHFDFNLKSKSDTDHIIDTFLKSIGL